MTDRQAAFAGPVKTKIMTQVCQVWVGRFEQPMTRMEPNQ